MKTRLRLLLEGHIDEKTEVGKFIFDTTFPFIPYIGLKMNMPMGLVITMEEVFWDLKNERFDVQCYTVAHGEIVARALRFIQDGWKCDQATKGLQEVLAKIYNLHNV